MGILRDTYIINETSPELLEGISMNLYNNAAAQKERLKYEKEINTRVDISLKEYDSMRKQIKELNCDNRLLRNAVNKICNSLKIPVESLYKAEDVSVEKVLQPATYREHYIIEFYLDRDR